MKFCCLFFSLTAVVVKRSKPYLTNLGSDFSLFTGLTEEEALALQNKLEAFYTIMNQEMEVLKEQSNKAKREKHHMGNNIVITTKIYRVLITSNQLSDLI